VDNLLPSASAWGDIPEAASEGHARTQPVVEVRGLKTAFGAEIVHDGLDLSLQADEILGLVGASGSGKSILLRVLLGLLTPDNGEVRIFGEDILAASEEKRRQLTVHWGVVFQEGALFSTMTVQENVAVVLRKHTAMSEELINEIAALKITLAQLPPEAAAQFPSELSGGMHKRAAIARALALDPRLLLLDEPTSGLDPITAAKLDGLIADLQKALGMSILLITHDLDTMFRVCHRVAVLADKKIVAVGKPEELARSGHPWVRSYFSGPRAVAAAESASRYRGDNGSSGRTRRAKAG
jgi:phospholipid/cholesterol/gamma-HCH transport system ATP-binding protein